MRADTHGSRSELLAALRDFRDYGLLFPSHARTYPLGTIDLYVETVGVFPLRFPRDVLHTDLTCRLGYNGERPALFVSPGLVPYEPARGTWPHHYRSRPFPAPLPDAADMILTHTGFVLMPPHLYVSVSWEPSVMRQQLAAPRVE